MTTELIKISTDTAGRRAVCGRELHEFLNIKDYYAQWFSRMCEYGFVENQDFEVLHKNVQNPQGGRPATDHAISLDMAKEVCMIQRSDKGKEARQYFIACERKLLSPKSKMEMVLESIKYLQDELGRAQEKIAEDKPKVEFANAVGECENGKNFRELGLVFKQNKAGFGQDGLIERLLRDKYIYRDVKSRLRPYAEYTSESGFFWTETKVIDSPKGTFETIQVKITPKGQQYFINKYMPLSAEVGGSLIVPDPYGTGELEVEGAHNRLGEQRTRYRVITETEMSRTNTKGTAK
jgi:anti-repressor protein